MADIGNKHFTIHGKDEHKLFLETILEAVTAKADIVRHFFDVSDYRDVKVTLFDDLDDLKDEADKTKKKYEEYAQGAFSNKAISVYVDEKLDISNVYKVVNKIIHQYSHIIYASVCENKDNQALWLDEGIAENLSGERSALQKSDEKCKKAFLSRILSRHKEIPKIEYLNQEGNKLHAIGSGRYYGYLMCYFMVAYLLEAKVLDNELTQDDIVALDNNYNPYEVFNIPGRNLGKKAPIKNRYNFSRIIRDAEYRKLIEPFLISRTVNYFGSTLGVKMSAASYKYIKEPKDLIDYMDANISYAWYDEKHEKNKNDFGFQKSFRVGSVNDVVKNCAGTSLEIAKFELEILKRAGYEGTIFVHKTVGDENSNGITFTHKTEDCDEVVSLQAFVLVEKDGQCYYLKNNRAGIDGVYEFGSFEAFLRYYSANLDDNSTLYEMTTIPAGLNCDELCEYLEQQQLVNTACLDKKTRKILGA